MYRSIHQDQSDTQRPASNQMEDVSEEEYVDAGLQRNLPARSLQP